MLMMMMLCGDAAGSKALVTQSVVLHVSCVMVIATIRILSQSIVWVSVSVKNSRVIRSCCLVSWKNKIFTVLSEILLC